MIALLALAMGLGLLLFCRAFFRDFAAPPGIYAIVWSGTIGLLFLDLVDYHQLGPELWQAIALSAFCFIGGCLAILIPALADLPKRPAFTELLVHRQRFEKALGIMALMAALGLVLQLVHLQRTIGLQSIWLDPVAARRGHSNVPIWGYLNLLNVSNLVVMVFYLGVFRKPKPWVYLILVPSLVSAAFTTDRTRLFYMVIWSFFLWIYLSGGLRFSLRKLARSGLVTGFLLLFFLIIASHYDRSYVRRFPQQIHFSKRFEALADPYIYLTGSLPALQAYLEDDHHPTHGRFTFSPIVSVLNLIFPEFRPPDLKGKLYFVPMELNTFSYLHQFYGDFGWFGIALGPLICGLLSGWLYVAMRRRPGFLGLYLGSLVAYCIAISIFVNFFTQEATWFFAGLGCLLHRYTRLRPDESPAELGECRELAEDG